MNATRHNTPTVGHFVDFLFEKIEAGEIDRDTELFIGLIDEEPKPLYTFTLVDSAHPNWEDRKDLPDKVVLPDRNLVILAGNPMFEDEGLEDDEE